MTFKEFLLDIEDNDGNRNGKAAHDTARNAPRNESPGLCILRGHTGQLKQVRDRPTCQESEQPTNAHENADHKRAFED